VSDLGLGAWVLALWDFRDPAGSQARFAEAADGAGDAAVRQSLLTQVARAQAMQKSFAAADATLDAIGDPDGLADEPAVRALLERGRIRNSSGDAEAAVPLFRAAYERALAAGANGLAADAAHMLAIALPPEEHERWAGLGLAIAEGSDDPLAIRMRGALLNNLGWTHADNGRWGDALDLFERAVAARQEAGDEWGLHVARWTRARALRALGRHDEALAELRELAATPEGAADSHVAAEILENETAAAAGPTGDE
jgi:tetratricopeptide (TPR) repeat protein